MKKHLFIAAALTASLMFTTTANAQFELAANTKKNVVTESADNEFTVTKAYQRFHKDFPEVQSESWAKTKHGFSVRFIAKGILTLVFLSKSGANEGQIRYYDEDNLAQNVRHIVKSTYYDYAIKGVQEVTYNDVTAYLITLEDKTSWKVVRVVSGEMDVRDSYNKAP